MIAVREESAEVLYAEDRFAVVGPADIAALKQRALKAPRGRCRICFHNGPSAPMHEMLIVHQKGAWVPPHKHVGKEESLHVIEGTALLVGFSGNGDIERIERIGDGGAILYRLPEGLFHTLLIESEWFVFHEAILGPFDRSKTVFPSWAPVEDGEAARAFTQNLRQQL